MEIQESEYLKNEKSVLDEIKTTFHNYLFGEKKKKKSHTCEEGGAHLRISVWHLLMNLKTNYLLKELLKWANKKCKYFNIYKKKTIIKNKEKHLEISLFFTCVPTIFMI